MRVLIVTDAIGVGGISSALRTFVNHIMRYAECDVMVFNEKSIPERFFPQNVRVLKSCFALRLLGTPQKAFSKHHFFLGGVRAWFVLIAHIFGGRCARSILLGTVKKVADYDYAFSYAQDVGVRALARGCNDFVLKKVKAKTKAAFIHCDYSRYGGYSAKQESTYKRFDNIICVSEGCKDSFARCFPRLSTKTRVIRNFIDIERVLTLSQTSQGDEQKYVFKDKINIVTVCRISEEKGIDRTLRVFSALKKHFSNFHWLVIGGGDNLIDYKELVRQLCLEENVSFVGERANPFSYMVLQDVFLLPSYHEAAPMVFGEAATLNLPIITTNTCSAKELVADGGLGVVCENTDKGLFDVLCQLLDNKLSVSKENYKLTYNNDVGESQLQLFLFENKEGSVI